MNPERKVNLFFAEPELGFQLRVAGIRAKTGNLIVDTQVRLSVTDQLVCMLGFERGGGAIVADAAFKSLRPRGIQDYQLRAFFTPKWLSCSCGSTYLTCSFLHCC